MKKVKGKSFKKGQRCTGARLGLLYLASDGHRGSVILFSIDFLEREKIIEHDHFVYHVNCSSLVHAVPGQVQSLHD